VRTFSGAATATTRCTAGRTTTISTAAAATTCCSAISAPTGFHYNVANDGGEGHDTIVGWSGDDMLVLWNTSIASTTDLADRT
jgi:hypothetical protein